MNCKNSIFQNCPSVVIEALQALMKSSYSIYRPADAGNYSILQYLADIIHRVSCEQAISQKNSESDRHIAFWFSHYFPTVISAMEAYINDDSESYERLLTALQKFSPQPVEEILADRSGILMKILGRPELETHLKKILFFDEAERIRLACGGDPQKTMDEMNRRVKNNGFERI